MDKSLGGGRADLRETLQQYLGDLEHPGAIYVGYHEVDMQTKMALLQDEPVKANIAPALPGHYTLQQCPASSFFC